MTNWEHFKLNCKEIFGPWWVETFFVWGLGIIAAIGAGWGIWHYLHWFEYIISAFILGMGGLFFLLKMLENPIRDEYKINKGLAIRHAAIEAAKEEGAVLKAGAIAAGNEILDLKHALEQKLGHTITISPAPVVAPAPPTQ